MYFQSLKNYRDFTIIAIWLTNFVIFALFADIKAKKEQTRIKYTFSKRIQVIDDIYGNDESLISI